MRRLLQRVAISLMKELIWRVSWRRIDWRRLFFVGAIMTVAGVVLPTFVLITYPMWFPSPSVITASHQPLNGSTRLSNKLTEARFEQFQLVPAAPTVSLNSTGVTQTLPSKKERARIRRSKRKRKKPKINDEPTVIPPPPRKTISPRLQRYIASLPPHEALVYAKREIEHASAIDDDDPYLYAPVFRNISVFMRSYELMEVILKVYNYPDGEKPIFHDPHLMGIYASEGWFMKLMEENKEFVTRDPEKAHLYYLPFSARQLELAVYVPNSHDLKPLSIFLKEYVNMIAQKYPFWNRTLGSDHFLVACHDWCPYTTTAHQELRNNTIKAVCNADLSEKIFVPGKDVSLPETAIRNPGRPLRNIGRGNRVSQRPILAFFAGNMHGRVRPRLLKHWHNKDEDMKIYGLLPTRVSRNISYIQHMKLSKYCICPMGYEVNSPRIVEAIYYECVPVIIADNFVLPLSEVLDWNAFSVTVAEKDIPKLKEILLAIPLRRYLKMQVNVKMVQKHFLWNLRPVRYDLFHMILHSIWFNRLNQIHVP